MCALLLLGHDNGWQHQLAHIQTDTGGIVRRMMDVDAQGFLSARHRQIDFGENLRIQ